jgi:hypothetical protein
MCVTSLFEDHDLSLLSTMYVDLRTNYNTKITQHKHTIQHNITKQDKQLKRAWFNILVLLGHCDKRDMARYRFKNDSYDLNHTCVK